MEKKSVIALVGRADHDNFGDSLMFAIYVKAASELNCSVKIVGATSIFITRLIECGLVCESMPVEDIDPDHISKVFFIGGGYFGEPDLGKSKWADRFIESSFFADVADQCINNGIEYHIIGPEIGPLSDDRCVKQVQHILSGSKTLAVRNSASADFVKTSFGLEAKVLTDVVLANASQFYNLHSSAVQVETDFTSKKISLFVHATGKLLKRNPLSWILRKKIIQLVCDEQLADVALCFDQSSYPELIPLAKKFLDELKSKCSHDINVSLYEYRGLLPLLSNISRSELVFTTKLHVGVTALSFGKKVICLSGMPKNKRFYHEIGANKALLPLYRGFSPVVVFDKNRFFPAENIDNGFFRSSSENISLFKCKLIG